VGKMNRLLEVPGKKAGSAAYFLHGFKYFKSKSDAALNTTYYKCAYRKKKNCGAILIERAEGGNYAYELSHGRMHIRHLPDFHAEEEARLIQELKRQVLLHRYKSPKHVYQQIITSNV